MKRAEYLTHLKELKKEAAKLGVKINTYYRPLKRPHYYGVRGSYSSAHKKIILTIIGNQSRTLILAVLAHEIRHALHHHLDLFLNYYDPRYEDENLYAQVDQGLISLPDLQIAQLAENDCNKWAVTWLAQRNIILSPQKKSYQDFFIPYPSSNTLAARLKSSYQHYKGRPRVPTI